jgi:hypothetical protein
MACLRGTTPQRPEPVCPEQTLDCLAGVEPATCYEILIIILWVTLLGKLRYRQKYRRFCSLRGDDRRQPAPHAPWRVWASRWGSGIGGASVAPTRSRRTGARAHTRRRREDRAQEGLHPRRPRRRGNGPEIFGHVEIGFIELWMTNPPQLVVHF